MLGFPPLCAGWRSRHCVQLNSPGGPLATPAPDLRLSLIPIFVSRLHLLKAIVPGLRELPRPYLDELQSLLERAEKLIVESAGRPVSSETESALDP